MGEVARSRIAPRWIGVSVLVTALGGFPGAAQTPSLSSPQPKSPFPEGPGRDALFAICSQCHGPESVLGQMKTRDEWSKTLDEMAGYGAQGSDEDWKKLLDYLIRHYSLIFVNKASAKELESTLDMPASVAEAIVRTRTDEHQFASIDDLKKVPGVDASKIDLRRDRLIF